MVKVSVIYPKRGEVYLVNFDPTVGAEIKKTRPAVVLQNNIANRYSPVTIVAALSSKFDMQLYPTEILLDTSEGGLKTPSVILLNQIRTIDKQRLVKKIGAISSQTMIKINSALQISLGIVEL